MTSRSERDIPNIPLHIQEMIQGITQTYENQKQIKKGSTTIINSIFSITMPIYCTY